ncbi:hypothetical protein BDW59DRAFT_177071 [Aspergillus cavernicola]|uniref:NAD(P)-binding protein n=1 Tax=Aspergillus cavernicola TaxID=176166 RepID=A0ABR4H855_9EURO
MSFTTDSVWFITGCSSGLGRSISSTVYKSGVLKLTLDVTSLNAIDSCFGTAVEIFGQINVVINNAGYGRRGDTEAASEEAARDQLETNFWGPVRITRSALRIFRETKPRGQGSTVVQISSVGGCGFPGNAFYHASKFALEGFTESVAKEMDPAWNIKFLLVVPGGVRTNFASTSMATLPRHPAYDTSNAPFTQLMKYVAGPASQDTWSDPDICARLLVNTVVSQEQRPLPTRLLMGAETIPWTKADMERTLQEIEDWRTETESCSPKGGAQIESFLST